MTRACVLLALLTGCSLQDFDSLQNGDAGATLDADLADGGGADGGVDTGTPPVDAGPDTSIPTVDGGTRCDDGLLNGDETDMDCGGSCTACDADGMCGAPTDCLSGVCTGNICVAPTCGDEVLNGDETDMDCGGSCDQCVRGDSCLVDADCAESACYSPLGTATCERVTFMTGTTVAVEAVQTFNGQSILRVDLIAPPTVIRNGTAVTLPASGGPFATQTITPRVTSSTVTVAGTALTNPTGFSYYQVQGSINFYGVIMELSDEATANLNEATLDGLALEATDVEIVIVDTSL